MMDKEFVPYKSALKLEKIGFDRGCIAYYDNKGIYSMGNIFSKNGEIKNSYLKPRKEGFHLSSCAAPMYQQAFDWFLEEHKLYSSILISGAHDWKIYIHRLNDRSPRFFKRVKKKGPVEEIISRLIPFSYELQDDISLYREARQQSLDMLIKLVEDGGKGAYDS